MSKKNYFNKIIDYYQVFLVAGGTDGSYNSLSSTETLVEGGQSWKVHQDLPTGRRGLRGISLPNTVIMTGKKKSHFTFAFNSQTQLDIFILTLF